MDKINDKITRAFKAVFKALDLQSKKLIVDPYTNAPYIIFYMTWVLYRFEEEKYRKVCFQLDTGHLNRKMLDETPKFFRGFFKSRILRTVARVNPKQDNKLVAAFKQSQTRQPYSEGGQL